MADSVAGGAEYFDYLKDYGDALAQKLGPSVKLADINVWRLWGPGCPDNVTVGCRKVVECGLNALSGNDRRVLNAKLVDKIARCHEDRLIPVDMKYKLDDMRKKGNRGAHANEKPVTERDAFLTLELLDDFLRFLLKTWGIAPDVPAEASVRNINRMFLPYSAEAANALTTKAEIAATLSGDESIMHEARRVTQEAVASSRKKLDLESQINELSKDLRSLFARFDQLVKDQGQGLGNELGARFGQVEDTLVGSLDEMRQKASKKNIEAIKAASDLDKRVTEVISEADYISRLLAASGVENGATDEQLEVLSFPRTKGTTTNTLLLRGGPGTGKTLCLLAKLIRDIDEAGQGVLEGFEPKRGLFLCFNTNLASYVRGILERYSEEPLPIDVSGYDVYVNQLVRARPREDYMYLAPYARNVRYPSPEYRVAYREKTKGYLIKAMRIVAARHPGMEREYYLDASHRDNLAWLAEEICWLDSRYESPEQAEAYLTAPRVGRGTKRLPNAQIRGVILEIWAEFSRIMAREKCYTVEGTTKRLMHADSLPKYDFIAVDEVQDFTVASIRLIMRLRKSKATRVYLSGDEDQKIYQRDFTWKEIDDGVHGHTITLKDNQRNPVEITRFADRLHGVSSSRADAGASVQVVNASDEGLVELVKKVLAETGGRRTTALIGRDFEWKTRLQDHGIAFNDVLRDSKQSQKGCYVEPGLYVIGEMAAKGLEFDNVIVDYTHELGEDDAAESRLRYVQFTRARRKLYVRYDGEAPRLLREYYPDFLE